MTIPLFDGRSFAAVLFDMDGTVLNSIAATQRVWRRWAARFGLDAHAVLRHIPGRRALDTVRALDLPGVDAAAEADEILRMEMEDVAGIHPISGAHEFLASLAGGRWAIVTSAPPQLAARRLAAAGLTPPAVLITADHIARGKPDPACFQLAAGRLGVDVADCLVFEDAPAGIQAGEAAGAQLIVITAAHAQPLPTRHPAFPSFDELQAEVAGGRIRILRRPAPHRAAS